MGTVAKINFIDNNIQKQFLLMSKISTLASLQIPTQNKFGQSSHRAPFQTPSKNRPANSLAPKNNYQMIRSPNFHERQIWTSRANKMIKLTPKVFIQNSTGVIFVENGEGCILEFLRKCNQQIRTSILIEILQSINALGKYYGYFYIDKHMMKISKLKEPLIWIHHNFKLNFREFPINHSNYAQKIFYDNTKRVMSSLIEFPPGLSYLTQMIDYAKKSSNRLNWKNIEAELVSRDSYSTSNGRVYSNLSNSPSGTRINEKYEMKTIKSSEMLTKKPGKKNVVKKIQIKDHHPHLFQSSSKKIFKLNSGQSQSSFTRSKDGRHEISEATESLTSRKLMPLQSKDQRISCFNEDSDGASVNLSPKKMQTLKPSYLINSAKQRKHSANANTELIKQWISTNLSKKFPYSTFSASTRVTCDTQIQQQIAQPNTPITVVEHRQIDDPNNFSFRIDSGKVGNNPEPKPRKQGEQNNQKKAKKWIDNYGGSNKISWGINSEIAEEQDSVLGDEVDKLFDSSAVKEVCGKGQLKESQLAKEIQNLFDSDLISESRQKKDEYLAEFEDILI